MRILFLCDSNYLKGDVNSFVNGFPRNHELVVMSSDDLLSKKAMPDGVQGILAERNTWQKSISIFRYFGLLPLLESVPLAPVVRGRRQEPLKARRGCKEVFFHTGSTPEEIFSTLDRFISMPPVQYQYPRGLAKA